MSKSAVAGRVPVAWWSWLIIAAMFLAGYFAITVVLEPVFEPIQTQPAALIPVIILGAAAGILVGRRDAARLKAPHEGGQTGRGTPRAAPTEPGRPSHRRLRSRQDVLRSASRAGLAGLTGCGLILAQMLPTSGLEWLCIGGVALSAGGAGHAWVMGRHYESVKTGLTG